MIGLWLGLAGAYELAGSSWAWQERPVEGDFYVNPAGFPFSEAEVRDAHLQAVRTWMAQGGTPLVLQDGGTSDSTRYGNGPDGLNLATFVPSTLGFTLAISARTVLGNEIVDCDIRFYGANSSGDIPWSIAESGAGPEQQDMRQTWIHEQGHCMGLSHSQVREAVMYATAPPGLGPASRRLHDDDRAGLRAIYGSVSPMPVVAEVVERPGPDGQIEVEVLLENLGDGTLWGFAIDAHPEGALEAVDPPGVVVGDVAAGDQARLSFLLGFSADCAPGEPASLRLRGEDESAWTWEDTLPLDARCPSPPVGDDSGQTDSGESGQDDAFARTCSAAPGGSWGLLLAFPLLLRRRRR